MNHHAKSRRIHCMSQDFGTTILNYILMLWRVVWKNISKNATKSCEKSVGHMAQLRTPIALFSRWGGKASGQVVVQHIKEVVVAKASHRVG